MLVAQLTDVHLGFDRGNPDEFNRQRLERVLDRIAALDVQPDLLLVTGDLVDHGDVGSYERLREAFARVRCPVHYAMGNHDLRDNFARVFPDAPRIEGGFFQHVIETPALRLILLDTLEEGRHGGAFCATRAAWAAARLDEAPARPTLIVLHHPPVETGIEWMTTDPDEPWVARLRGVLAGRPQIVGMIAGHIHRPIVTGWAGLTVAVCPSTAPQVGLTLASIDPEVPDGRPMIVADPPAFALHWWNGRALVTHFDDAAAGAVLARFESKMQPLVRSMIEERPVGVPFAS